MIQKERTPPLLEAPFIAPGAAFTSWRVPGLRPVQPEPQRGQQELPAPVQQQWPAQLQRRERQPELLLERPEQPRQPERHQSFPALPTCRPWPDTG